MHFFFFFFSSSQVFKEEVTTFSGLVVTETVPQLENADDFYESVYEEEPEEVTELGSDVDFGEEEEIEVDSKFIEDVGGSQIVTAISLSQNSPLSSQMVFSSKIFIDFFYYLFSLSFEIYYYYYYF